MKLEQVKDAKEKFFYQNTKQEDPTKPMFPTLDPNGWHPEQAASKPLRASLSGSQLSLASSTSTATQVFNCNLARHRESASVTPKLNSKQTILSSNPQLSSYKFHRAAIDGYLDMLCQASKRDTNHSGHDQLGGLTPTLLAASSGQLEALRILVGRGGDPERTTVQGFSALHLAAAKNHLNCVSFLVNFGVNMWSLDNDLHTAKDVAAIEQQTEVLDYLDEMMARQSAINTKQVQKFKEKAKLAAEKRMKLMRKEQMKAIKQVEKDERLLAKLSHNRRLLKAAHSISDIKLVGRQLDLGYAINPSVLINSDGISNGSQAIKEGKHSFLGQRCKSSLNLNSNSLSSASTKSILSSSNTNRSSDLESAYASSISSTSAGYLSSESSTRSFLKSMMGQATLMSQTTRNYPATDANGGVHQRMATRSPLFQNLKQLSSMSNQGATISSRPKYSDLVAIKLDPQMNSNQASKSPSVHSSVTKRSKLRAISGVSRKVQLKRLLFSNTSSSNDSNQLSSFKLSTERQNSGKDDQISARPGESSQLEQPKHNGTLSRTKSEPDFMSLGCITSPATDQLSSTNKTQAKSVANTSGKTPTTGLLVNDQLDDRLKAPPLPPPLPPQAAVKTLDIASVDDANSQLIESESHQDDKLQDQQQKLLTKCLSQLKMQHEAITGKSIMLNDGNCEQEALVRPSKLATAISKQVKFEKSDELIRHQLTAGEFPIRPSIIKQKQHQKTLNSSKLALNINGNETADQLRFKNRPKQSNTVTSVDSIGSAGSLIERDLFESSTSCTSSSSQCSTNLQANPTAPKVFNSPGSLKPNATATQPADQLENFLALNGLAHLMPALLGESIDLEALLLLNESDLKSLNILLGPRRKLLNAIAKQKLQRLQVSTREIEHVNNITATSANQQQTPKCLVIDTQF